MEIKDDTRITNDTVIKCEGKCGGKCACAQGKPCNCKESKRKLIAEDPRVIGANTSFNGF